MINESILIDPSINLSTYEISENQLLLKYPCTNTSECFPIKLFLYAGRYKLEAFGASGGSQSSRKTSARSTTNASECLNEEDILSVGGNYSCARLASSSGAGGYTSGYINLRRGVNFYINIGGQGEHYVQTNTSKGGYNGGGGVTFWRFNNDDGGSGGGATDFRVFKDTLFHRILVAGGGGGADDGNGAYGGTLGGYNDGSGGSGGLIGQGYWTGGVYESSKETTTMKGFSFGYGMTGTQSGAESPGGGGGFFGGLSDKGWNSGGAGGSSFALNPSIDFPRGLITVKDSSGIVIDSGYYKFDPNGEFSISNPYFITGANIGNGYARITLIESRSNIHIEPICSFSNKLPLLSSSLLSPFILT